MNRLRHRVLVLGGSLDRDAGARDGLDAAPERAWMREAAGESTHRSCSHPRMTLQVGNVQRTSARECAAIGVRADALRHGGGGVR